MADARIVHLGRSRSQAPTPAPLVATRAATPASFVKHGGGAVGTSLYKLLSASICLSAILCVDYGATACVGLTGRSAKNRATSEPASADVHFLLLPGGVRFCVA